MSDVATTAHPHSIPTRRSSDLSRIQRILAYASENLFRPAGRRGYHHPHPGFHARRPVVGTQRILRDRKSTRLNSSHLVISYAVFCLKNKKREDRQRMPQARELF